MNSFIVSLLGGVGLGVFFYGGLWLTVRRLPATAHPILLTLSSFWIRTLIVVTAFVFLVRMGLEYALIAMVSFILGRLAVSLFLPARRPLARCT